MKIQKISVIVPCYNEISTIQKACDALQEIYFGREKEIIIVDDGSTDGTKEFLEKLRDKSHECIIIFHDINKGKGAAIKTALEKVTGDYVIIQDADLEYNPKDIIHLIECAEKNNALVVYGSRNRDIKNTYLYSHFYWGSKLLTFFINVLYRQKITDPETCYKLVEKNMMRFIDIHEKGFGVEMEITLKIIKLKIPILEVSISYSPRGFDQGKKIQAKDGLWALYLIFWHALHDMHFGIFDCILRYFRVHEAEKLHENMQGKEMLDVGCGRQGYLGWKYRRMVKSYFGLDAKIVSSTIQNLTFIKDDAKNIFMHFPEKKFDIIIALAFIEHINDPEGFLEKCNVLLKHNGIIILSSPSPLAHPILRTLSFLGLINKEEIDCHKQYFVPEKIVAMLINARFDVIKNKRFLLGLNTIVMAKRKSEKY